MSVNDPVVNDDLILEVGRVCKKFVKDIGLDLNGKSKEVMWNTKADEVRKLEKFIRDKLAEDKMNFCFLENGS